MGIYNSLAIEGNTTYVSAKLMFTVPFELNNNNKEIICTSGSDENSMSCPFVIEGKLECCS